MRVSFIVFALTTAFVTSGCGPSMRSVFDGYRRSDYRREQHERARGRVQWTEADEYGVQERQWRSPYEDPSQRDERERRQQRRQRRRRLGY